MHIKIKTDNLFRGTDYLNPSIIRWRGDLLLACRYERGKPNSLSRIGATKLSESYEPLDRGIKLQLPAIARPPWRKYLPYRKHIYKVNDDPRWLIWQDKLWITYTDRNHQWIAQLDDDLQTVEAWRSPQENPEKNWQFFVHQNELWCVYKMQPYVVHKINLVDGLIKFTEIHQSPVNFKWEQWGEPRGGTLPLLVDDHYYAFFHSNEMCDNYKLYHMGVYKFEAKPPFRVISVSRQPILSADLAARPRSFNRRSSVVFPCGVLFENNKWIISLGWNDRECRIYEFQNSLDMISVN